LEEISLNRIKANLLLLLAVAIWGVNYVVVKIAVTDMPPYSFISLRFIIATLAFFPMIFRQRKRVQAQASHNEGRQEKFRLMPGIAIGLALLSAYLFQTVGLVHTTATVAGFLTSLYVVFVPLAGWLVFRHTISLRGIFGIALCLIGLRIFGIDKNFNMGLGEWLMVGCAASYAIQIIAIGRFSPRFSTKLLTFTQIATVAVGATLIAIIYEFPIHGFSWINTTTIWAILFTGIIATTAAYLIQTFSQKFTSATDTAVIFAGEPLFAAVAGYLLISEPIGTKMIMGGILMIIGIIIVNLSRIGNKS
jgi:drug/metabolite transporter (DMT)-like permease